jgi:alpha/beta superfamily hydrolase
MRILQHLHARGPAAWEAMAKAPSTEHLSIEGPAGVLEALVDAPADGGIVAIAVVLHPHPQHGGTMQNKVTHTLARALVGLDFAALRFNFRGTGGSAGRYADGDGEVEDAVAAAGFMRNRHPGRALWLAGFSFGAAIGGRAASDVGAAGLISGAPAARRVAGTLDAQPECPWLVLQGDADEVVDVNETVAWVDGLEPGPELRLLKGVDHFFHGKLNVLREAVTDFVTPLLASQPGEP